MDYDYDYTKTPRKGPRDMFKYNENSVTDIDDDAPATARNAMDGDMRRTYRRHYDLNLLSKMMEQQEAIPRVDLNLADHQQLQFFLCQLRQLLQMLQLSNTDMLDVLLIRCDALKEMYDLPGVHEQVQQIVKQYDLDQKVDTRVAKNME